MLTSTIENVLNRGLPRSPRAQQLCAELAGHSILIEVAGMGRLRLLSNGLTLRVATPSDAPSSSGAVSLSDAPSSLGAASLSDPPSASDTSSASAPPDAIITGGPFGLLALAGPNPEAVLQRGDVRIEGDAQMAERFRELAILLRPDLEEELSLVVGDVPAHAVGRFTRAAAGWTRMVAAKTLRNAAEYLGHERRDLVPRAEADQFLRGVDEMREEADRLEARIERLRRS